MTKKNGNTLNVFCCTSGKTIEHEENVGSVKEFMPHDPKERRESQKQKLKPSSIKAYLDEYIIGQDKAKQILSVAVYNHFKRIKMKIEHKDDPSFVELEKGNILLLGPSGSGKTATLKRLAKFLKVPFVTVDITSYTSAGYAGKDVESILRELYYAADNDIAAAERGIVFIDEIDKIARRSDSVKMNTDPGHEGVQQALLRMIEGDVVEVPMREQAANAQSIKINTEDILFVCGGAFEGIQDIVKERMGQNKRLVVGFNTSNKEEDSINDDNYILEVKTEDLKAFGMVSEFLGRIPVICGMQKLSEEALVSILTKPKNAIVKQYKALFERDGIELEFDENALRLIAKTAIERNTGARALRGIMEELLLPIMFEVPDEPEDSIKKILYTVSEDNEFEYKYIRKEEVKSVTHAYV